MDEKRKSLVFGVLNDLAHGRHVVILEAAPESVGQHLFGHHADEDFRLGDEIPAEPDDAVHVGAVEERAGRIDLCAVLGRSASGRWRRSFRARSRSGPSPCGSRRRPDRRGASPCARAMRAPCRRRRLPCSGGTLGGGGCGGTPSRLVRIHLPRSTGEVRFGYEVTVSMLAWPSSPRRASLVTVTRRNWLP